MNNKTILHINRDNKTDAGAMFKQWGAVAFYRFCDWFEMLQAKYQ